MSMFMIRRISLVLIVTIFGTLLRFPTTVEAGSRPGQMPLFGADLITLTSAFQAPVITGMRIHPTNPLAMDFFVDPGDAMLSQQALADETIKMVHYFLAALAIPDNQLWVNLSPRESHRIMGSGLENTAMGQTLLAQDYVLKKLTASLLYPEGQVGQEFWQRLYARLDVSQDYDLLNMFQKVWIVPDTASVYVDGQSVFVNHYHLRVMLEEDYITETSQFKVSAKDRDHYINAEAKTILRETIIPILEEEVNHGQHFAPLRQIIQVMVLGKWYKENLRQTFLGQSLTDQNRLEPTASLGAKENIYDQYLKLFSEGVFDGVQESYDPQTQKMVSRRFLSGGIKALGVVAEITESMTTKKDTNPVVAQFEWRSIIGGNSLLIEGADQGSSSLYKEKIVSVFQNLLGQEGFVNLSTGGKNFWLSLLLFVIYLLTSSIWMFQIIVPVLGWSMFTLFDFFNFFTAYMIIFDDDLGDDKYFSSNGQPNPVGGIDLSSENYLINDNTSQTIMITPEWHPEHISVMPFEFITPVLKSIQSLPR